MNSYERRNLWSVVYTIVGSPWVSAIKYIVTYQYLFEPMNVTKVS